MLRARVLHPLAPAATTPAHARASPVTRVAFMTIECRRPSKSRSRENALNPAASDLKHGHGHASLPRTRGYHRCCSGRRVGHPSERPARLTAPARFRCRWCPRPCRSRPPRRRRTAPRIQARSPTTRPNAGQARQDRGRRPAAARRDPVRRQRAPRRQAGRRTRGRRRRPDSRCSCTPTGCQTRGSSARRRTATCSSPRARPTVVRVFRGLLRDRQGGRGRACSRTDFNQPFGIAFYPPGRRSALALRRQHRLGRAVSVPERRHRRRAGRRETWSPSCRAAGSCAAAATGRATSSSRATARRCSSRSARARTSTIPTPRPPRSTRADMLEFTPDGSGEARLRLRDPQRGRASPSARARASSGPR